MCIGSRKEADKQKPKYIYVIIDVCNAGRAVLLYRVIGEESDNRDLKEVRARIYIFGEKNIPGNLS